jgi:uncharacterized membrane protein
MAHAEDGLRDPASGRIRVLYVGEPTGMSPYPMLESDPLIWPYPVQASTVVFTMEVAKRSMRQYMPRTFDDLSAYQVFILSDANAGIFTSNQLKWYKDSVNQGSGLVMVGGNEAFGGRGGQASWGPTPVGEVLPVDTVTNSVAIGRVEITQPDHPFIASLPLDSQLDWMRNYDGNEIRLRDGAEELAKLVPYEIGPLSSFWATWTYGEGRTFAISGDWTPAGGVVFMRWEYYGDFAINLMLYLSGNEMPTDLETLHQVRGKFLEYRSSKAYLLNVMDFGEKFGANMNPVSDIIGLADAKYREATRSYLELEYVETLGILDQALEGIIEGAKTAINLKDQALLWIFVIEWTTVSGTFTMCGFILWTLMVRRRLYRAIETTRFSR